jgi:hypothetical protein
MSYIGAPIISQSVEVRVIEWRTQLGGCVVIVGSEAVEEVVTPFSFVSWLALLIIEMTVAIDQVITEITLIIGASRKHNPSLALHPPIP